MAYLSNTSVNGDLGVSGLVSVGTAGLKFTSGIINIFGGTNSGGTGGNSISIGNGAAATNDYSIAIGDGAKATGSTGIAIGSDAKASSLDSLAIGSSAKAEYNYSIALGYDATTSTSNELRLGSGTSGTGIKTIRACQAITITASDIRDKTDITPIQSALEFINNVTPITYVRNSRLDYAYDKDNENYEDFSEYDFKKYDKSEHQLGTKKGSRRIAGVKAQEVLELEKRIYGSDNYINLVYDNQYNMRNEGKDIPEGVENAYSVNYIGFIPLLIRSIQELDSKNKLLEERIIELEKKIKKEE